jgi:hypothetical protein
MAGRSHLRPIHRLTESKMVPLLSASHFASESSGVNVLVPNEHQRYVAQGSHQLLGCRTLPVRRQMDRCKTAGLCSESWLRHFLSVDRVDRIVPRLHYTRFAIYVLEKNRPSNIIQHRSIRSALDVCIQFSLRVRISCWNMHTVAFINISLMTFFKAFRNWPTEYISSFRQIL